MKVFILLLSAFLLTAVLTGQETDGFDDPFADDTGDDQTVTESDIDDPFADIDDPFAEFDDPFAAVSEDETGTSDETSVPPEDQADDAFSAFDLDSFFMDEQMITEESGETTDLGWDNTEESAGVSWSGSYSGSLRFSWSWDDYWNKGFAREADGDSLSPSIGGRLIYDARPDQDFRVLGKFGLDASAGFSLSNFNFDPADYSIEFVDGTLVVTENQPSDEENTDASAEEEALPSPFTLTLAVRELFSDFNWDRKLFFRFGKSFISWGVGYFWSPADILNLTTIDAEDPTAERQGPINLKINYPIGVNNLYLYLLTDEVARCNDIGIAAKLEFVVGDYEIGISGIYRRDLAPRAAATFSGSLGDFGLFGEGVVSFGSDRTFVRESRNQPEFDEDTWTVRYVALDTFQVDNKPFFSGTAGFLYQNSDWDMTVMGQYYFNGEGYPVTRLSDGSSLLNAAAYLYNNADTNGLALPAENQPDDYQAPLDLALSDLVNFGQHYAGLSLGFSNIFDTDLGFSLFWLGNLTDWSGIISPSISWKFFDHCSMNFSCRFSYGEAGDEYTDPASLYQQTGTDDPQVPTLDMSVSFSLGGGSF